MFEHQGMTSDMGGAEPQYGLDFNMSGCQTLFTKVLAACALLGALATFLVIIVSKTMADVFESKTSAAWARAAQLDAQANLVDARTAQLGTLLVGLLPIILTGMIVIAAISLVIVTVVLTRRGREQEQQLSVARSQLNLGAGQGNPLEYSIGERGLTNLPSYAPADTTDGGAKHGT